MDEPGTTPRTVLVTGATGYIGGRLVPELLAAGHRVRCLVRSPQKLAGRTWVRDVEVVQGDGMDQTAVRGAMRGVDAAYYLIHSMDGDGDFAERDRRLAQVFRDAAAAEGVRRLVYLGGLGDERAEDLSHHLRSRHEVGRVLADGSVPVTELRAAIIIGSGSASFEMLRNLVEVLPAMVTPRWVDTLCQPIAIRDILSFLVHVLDVPETAGEILEVGGPDVLTYRQMMRIFADEAGLRKRIIVPVPVLTPRLSSLWIGLVTPIPAGLARPLVDSLVNEVVVRERPITRYLPRDVLPFREAVRKGLQRVQDLDVATTWAQAEIAGRGAADPLPEDPDWSGGTVLADERELVSSADPRAVFDVVQSLGGDRGYLYADVLWELRGLADAAIGGVGLRRGRRHPTVTAVGEAVDFWRVERYDPPRLLRLRAEMTLPGSAWLEFRIEPDGDGSRLTQRARFHPRGLWGRAYWYGLLPFHAAIFPRMAARIVQEAEAFSAARKQDQARIAAG